MFVAESFSPLSISASAQARVTLVSGIVESETALSDNVGLPRIGYSQNPSGLPARMRRPSNSDCSKRPGSRTASVNVSPGPSLSSCKCNTPLPNEPTTANKLSDNGAKSRAPFTAVYVGDSSFPECKSHETISVSKMAHKRPLITTNRRRIPRNASPATSRSSSFIRPTVAPSLPCNPNAKPPGKPALAGSGSSMLAAPTNVLFCKS